MIHISTFFISVFLFICGSLTGECQQIHCRNQEIFAKVIQSHLQKGKSSQELFEEIDQIGEEALAQGVDLSCYRIDFEKNLVHYASIPIWEGEAVGEEYVFLLFVWPGEKELMKRGKCQGLYKTNIHSHPILCGYTVLANTITERRFLPVEGCERKIRSSGRVIIQKGEKQIDLNQEPFIHQLLYEGEGVKPAITLHLYGCGSANRLAEIFAEERSECVYPENSIVP